MTRLTRSTASTTGASSERMATRSSGPVRVVRATALGASTRKESNSNSGDFVGPAPAKAKKRRDESSNDKFVPAKRARRFGRAAFDADSDSDEELLKVPPPPTAAAAKERTPPLELDLNVSEREEVSRHPTTTTATTTTTTTATNTTTTTTTLSAIADAKAAFKPGSAPGRLVAREFERNVIAGFLKDARAGGRSLYVSGVPGTGKSAMIDEILDDFVAEWQEETEYQLAKINCMLYNDPHSIYKKIMSEFNVPDGAFGTNQNEPYRALERKFGFMDGGDKLNVGADKKIGQKKSPKPAEPSVVHILVLDEIDQLATKDQTVLYRIFEWPTLPGSSLILIGIANALDLMQRYLPRLSGMKGGPKLLNFNPYTPSDISCIIKSRLVHLQQSTLRRLNPHSESLPPHSDQLSSFMHPMAIEMCARKSAGTGDLRRALDLVRMSFEVLEAELRRKQEPPTPSKQEDDSENNPPHRSFFSNRSSGPHQDLLRAPLDSLASLPKVSVQHVIKAANAASGLGPVQKVRTLAAQQKAVLVALMDLMGPCTASKPSAATAADPHLGALHEQYVAVLKRKKLIKPCTKTEFGDIIALFESIGLVSLSKAKEERMRKVRLECLPQQVEDGIRDDPVLWGMWVELRDGGGRIRWQVSK